MMGSSLTEARKNGWTWYYTGKPCKRGHIAPRLASCGRCKVCHKIQSKAFRKTKKYRAWKSKYDAEYAAKNLHRRQMLKRATPPGYDLECIKSFYEDCPTGYHVDHIIPLNGENVCGLHVLENLQYLPAAKNFSKKNIPPKHISNYPTCEINV